MSNIVVQNTDQKQYFTLQKNGGVWDLSGGGITVTMYMRALEAAAKKITAGACVLETATSGEISYTPAAGDFDTVDRYYVQFRVISGGLYQPTRPMILEVEEEI